MLRVILINGRGNNPNLIKSFVESVKRRTNVSIDYITVHRAEWTTGHGSTPYGDAFFLRMTERSCCFKTRVERVAKKIASLLEYCVVDIPRLFFRIWRTRTPVVHVWWPFRAELDIIWLSALKAAGVKVVWTVNNRLPHYGIRFVNELSYRVVYRIPDVLIFHSEEYAKEFVSVYPWSVPRVRFVPFGVMYEQFPLLSLEESRGYLGWGKEFTVMYWGDVREHKGLDYLICAVGSLALKHEPFAIRFVVCGQLEWQAEKYKTALEQLGGRVILDALTESRAEDARVAEMLCAADVLVLPYRSGHLSSAGMAALRFGTPMIVSDVGGLPSMVADRRWVFRRGDVSQLVSLLGELYALSPLEREGIRASQYALGKRFFSWDAAAEAAESVYNRLVIHKYS